MVAALDRPTSDSDVAPAASPVPTLVVGWSMAACSLMMVALIFVNEQNQGTLGVFAGVLAIISATTLLVAHRRKLSQSA